MAFKMADKSYMFIFLGNYRSYKCNVGVQHRVFGVRESKKHIQFIPQSSRDLEGIGHAPKLSVINISKTKSHTNDVAVSKIRILGPQNLNIMFSTVYDLCLTLHVKATLSEMVVCQYLDR